MRPLCAFRVRSADGELILGIEQLRASLHALATGTAMEIPSTEARLAEVALPYADKQNPLPQAKDGILRFHRPGCK
eukprot:SAG31_NODE_930_length_10920_cov_4.478329_8_plen_76_part_00